ncbi:Domain of uncharacterised function (DUF3784) [Niallia circulans]|nr:Domain of uncharacterised function (DUF3784) [Niallia circulans]
MILLFFLMISLFFGISTLLFIGKGDFLIAGLNAMSKKEKEKIDTFKLNRLECQHKTGQIFKGVRLCNRRVIDSRVNHGGVYG